MSVTCDRCSAKITGRPYARLQLDDFAVSVHAYGQHLSDEPDLCPACLIEIAKKGNALSPPSKKEGEE
jgi:hypothetical protein